MVKSQVQRISEIMEIKEQLKKLGFPNEYSAIKEFDRRTNQYVKDGVSWSGKIKFPEYKRELHVILTTQDHLSCNAVLKVIK